MDHHWIALPLTTKNRRSKQHPPRPGRKPYKLLVKRKEERSFPRSVAEFEYCFDDGEHSEVDEEEIKEDLKDLQ